MTCLSKRIEKTQNNRMTQLLKPSLSGATIVVSILLLTSCSLFRAPSPLRDAALSPDGRFLALCFEERNEIEVYNIATGERSTILSSSVPLFQPIWSPDGQQIGYTADNEAGRRTIYAVKASPPGEPREICAGSTPHWSPKGGLIAFADDSGNLRTVNPLSGESQELQRPEPEKARYLGCWSPDGRRIAFMEVSQGLKDSGTWVLDISSAKKTWFEGVSPLGLTADGKRLIAEEVSSLEPLEIELATSVRKKFSVKGVDQIVPSPNSEAFLARDSESRTLVLSVDGSAIQNTGLQYRSRGWSGDGQRFFVVSKSGFEAIVFESSGEQAALLDLRK